MVSQLEPRSIAYITEDTEFRDKIYEANKDAYISLGALTYPDKMAKIFEQCGFHYDETQKEWVGGNYKQVKELAQQPLPGLPKGIRGLGKVGLISIIYGRGSKSLAQSAGLKTTVMEKTKDAMMGNWTNVANYRNHKTMYLEYTGTQIETALGDRILSRDGRDKASTQAVNYGNQGTSSLLATSAFFKSYQAMRDLDELIPNNEIKLQPTPEGIVHKQIVA